MSRPFPLSSRLRPTPSLLHAWGGAWLRRGAITALAATLALGASVGRAATDAPLAEGIMLNLVSLVSARLAVAKSSAQWKWQNHEPVTQDQAADDVLLAAMNKLAPQYGLDPAFAKTFFDDQTQAARHMQSALFAAWKTGPAPDKVDPAAFESARAESYRISQGMLPALVRVAPLRARDDCPIVLSQALTRWTTQMATLDAPEREALRATLKDVCTTGGVGGTA